ncbi:MAG: AzlD domain-containing protein [Firmicutes bacterium]|nr:AzlD domain-containing protein [Bacillota bacterium]
MPDIKYSIMIIAVVALGTLFTRAVPFLLFAKKKPPKTVVYVGTYLPSAVIAILIVYCICGNDLTIGGLNLYAILPKVIAGIAVVILHVWKRNNLLSIAAGTVLYMVLVQRVFI